jgi:predicted P-loop ATPase
VFAGTTNELEGNYIQDQSGARRFWPIKVGVTHRPDIASLKAVRDLLWAEAVYAYEAGEDWFVVPAETVRLEQEERQMRPEDIDPWYGQILQGLKQADTYENHLFQAKAVYVQGQPVEGMLIFAGEFHAILGILLKVEGARQQASDVFRVRAILRQIGFKKVRSRRAVNDSNYQYQLRKEDIHPETWEMIVKAVEKSGIAIES